MHDQPTLSGVSEGVARKLELDAAAQGAGAKPHALGGASKGAPPSNTAPDNCNGEGFKALRYGIDSLYLSYPGTLNLDWEAKLEDLKLKAQSEDEAVQSLAQVKIGEHLFEVKDRGKGKYAFVLVDNCFHLQVSSSRSAALPLAYVQIGSAFLAAVGPEAAEQRLRFVVNTLGIQPAIPTLSRVDLFLDFVCDLSWERIKHTDWMTRPHTMGMYFERKRFSGWTFGMGGDLAARLYNKTLQAVKRGLTYLFDLWAAMGWSEEKTVWRMEFQVRREVLKELSLNHLPELLRRQASLWQYLTQDWLRLTVPNPKDQTEARWPNHRLWDAISGVYLLGLDQPKLTRFSPARPPSDERLFVHGLGGLTSFMAREGITDFGEGLGEYLAQARYFHDVQWRKLGRGFERYLQEKIAAKGRRYNTIRNKPKDGSDKVKHQEKAGRYRKAKDGE